MLIIGVIFLGFGAIGREFAVPGMPQKEEKRMLRTGRVLECIGAVLIIVGICIPIV